MAWCVLAASVVESTSYRGVGHETSRQIDVDIEDAEVGDKTLDGEVCVGCQCGRVLTELAVCREH